jgi:hypothetical protein
MKTLLRVKMEPHPKKKKLQFNGTVRYNRTLRVWATSCDICWKRPGLFPNPYASTATTKRRGKAAVRRHIQIAHGVEALVREGSVIE